MTPRNRSHGITLVELLFTVGLVAMLAGLAAPGFMASLRAAAVRSATFELLAGLQQLRAQSILENRPGLLCPVDASGACLAPGSAGTGWRAQLDGAAQPEVGRQSLTPGLSLQSSRSPLRFWPGPLAASTGTLTICDRRHHATPRAIVVSQNGRARVTMPGAAACAP